VVIADIRHELAAAAAARLAEEGWKVGALALDLSDPASIRRCAQEAIERLGGLDGLVNNGAVTDSGGVAAEALEVDTWDRVMDVNVRGTWLMTMACAGALRASARGAVVNLASDTPLWGAPRLLAYVASKGAIIAMTRSLARELGDGNVTVNAIAPGLTLVEATAYVPQVRHRLYVEQRALQREQLPDDVCGAVLFCLSDLSRFVTGQVLAVNGGFVMN
jgi:NAD(P)-dependent dehydrogenase (short-subunit alcohol dehydrogenase family)